MLTVRTRIAAFVLAVSLVAVGSVQAQGGITVDEALAKRGKTLFTNKGCAGCHTVGKGKRSGPDLAGVTMRRDIDWLKRFMTDPAAMFASDSLAKAMLEEYKGVKMPNMRLKPEEIDALLHYIQQESGSGGGMR